VLSKHTALASWKTQTPEILLQPICLCWARYHRYKRTVTQCCGCAISVLLPRQVFVLWQEGQKGWNRLQLGLPAFLHGDTEPCSGMGGRKTGKLYWGEGTFVCKLAWRCKQQEWAAAGSVFASKGWLFIAFLLMKNKKNLVELNGSVGCRVEMGCVISAS